MCRCISLTSFLPDSDSDCALVRLTYIQRMYRSDLKGRDHPSSRMVTTALLKNGASSPATIPTTRGEPASIQKKKQGINKKKSPQARKKKQRLPPLLVYIELLMRSITRQKTLPTFPHHSADRKSTMPSSQPLYRTLHPINIPKRRRCGRWENVKASESVAYNIWWFFFFFLIIFHLPFACRQTRRTPHRANDSSP
jgi:hypothetical protein